MADLNFLRGRLRELDQVVVAFSGGADSAFLARVANDTLGAEKTLCVTAISPSLAPEEHLDCSRLADEWGLRWQPVYTDELANTAYSANDGSRCFHCKTELLDAINTIVGQARATVILGVNVDDLGDHRPGQMAALDRGGVFPLVEAGFTKHDVREISRRLGLRTWDKPAAACLASRVPYGTPVTLEVLSTVAKAESALRSFGFKQLRVRHYGKLARIEVDESEFEKVIKMHEEIVKALKIAGYSYVTLDLEGFRSGNLNAALKNDLGSKV